MEARPFPSAAYYRSPHWLANDASVLSEQKPAREFTLMPGHIWQAALAVTVWAVLLSYFGLPMMRAVLPPSISRWSVTVRLWSLQTDGKGHDGEDRMSTFVHERRSARR
jgi:hypothetical protein